jgi:hypothetical protein
LISRPEFGTKGYETFPYPAPAVYPHLLYNQFAHPFRVYVATVLFAALAGSAGLAWKLKALSPDSRLSYLAVLITALTPFPLLFLIDRGNLEGCVFILTLAGVFLFYRKLYYISAVFLAFAAAMKIFPAVLFLIFITRKKYWPFATAVVAAAGFTLLAWAGIGPTIMGAAMDSARSGGMLKNLYILGFRPGEIGWDHSLMGAIKQGLYMISRLMHVPHNPKDVFFRVPGVETASAVYGIAVPFVFAFFYWRRIFALPVLNQVISFILLSVMLPFVSNEYTLVHVYIAWGGFLLFLYQDVRTGRTRMPHWKMNAILVCFAVTFSMQSYWLLGDVDNLGGQIKTVALLFLVWLVVTTPMPSTALGELATAD